MRNRTNWLFPLFVAIIVAGCGKTPQELSNLKSEYVTLDDSIRIHYKIHHHVQASKTICFVHGFGCDLNTWKQQFEGLRNEEDMNLVFIDLPGHGKSSKPHVDYTLEFYSRAVNKVLDNNAAGAVFFVGHSLGTPVCRQVIQDGHKGSLIDVDGVYCFYDGTETPEYIEAVQQFGHAFDGANCSQVIEGFVSSLAGPNTPQEIKNYAMSIMPQTPQHVASSTMQNLVQRRWWTQIPINTKTLVFCTQNSGIEPDNHQKMKQLYPQLEYIELTTCGHFIHMEESDMFNNKLKQFIDQQ